MALDPEELKKKRQLRQQQREERRSQQRKMAIRLVVAAVVLLLCGVMIFVVSRNGGDPSLQTEQTQQTQQTAAPSQEETEPDAAQPTSTIRLAFAGDLNVTDGVVRAGGNRNDYTKTFLDVAHLFADADLAALNFEGNLYGEPYGTATHSAPQELMSALDRIGVDVIQLANSYSINTGLSGLVSTISGVRAAGMEPLGVYADQAAYKAGKGYILREINGIRVAMVAFTKGMDGMALPAGSENCVNVLYTDYDSTYQTLNRDKIGKVLDAAAEASPDVIIAMLHWGSEYNDTISKSQKQIVTFLQEKGVDAIIGTHSHYVQKMEYDPETGRFVAYSLGDFLSDAKQAGSEYSVILNLEVTKDNTTGQTKISGYDYTPVFTVTEKGSPVRSVRIAEAMKAYEDGHISRVSESTYQAMAYGLERIGIRVAGQ